MHVSALWRYPVKSCRGHAHAQLTLGPRGFHGDRRWMIVDPDGRFITQRQHPEMIKVHTWLESTTETLSLKHKNELIVTTRPPASQPTQTVTVWHDSCLAQSASPQVNETLSAWFQRPVTLVYFPDDQERQVDLTYARRGDQVGFADGFPILLTSESSLMALNQHLSPPIEMERFRANLIITGAEAFAEDDWREVRIGGVTFEVAKPCARCVIPSINLDTAQKEPHVLEGLRTHRLRDHKVIFGQNLIHRGKGTLRVGDQVEILA